LELLVPIGIILAVIIFLLLFFNFIPVGLWISAFAAGVRVGIFTLVGMRLRRVIPGRIILPLIKARKAGLDISVNQLEAHYLAGGNVDKVVNALIAAYRANMDLQFVRAAAIDLAGRDVLEAVKMSVNPRVIETPNISAMAKDGIELLVKARVTVRANLDRLIGGAGEATIIARVGEGIVTTVGSSESHKDVLENPDIISQTVLDKGLDSGTAFEILSIDIADVDVGRNIGAQLQISQAEADKSIAQAKAEERRAMAVAKEQEMKALVQEMRARVVEAEAEVPRAMANALNSGKLGAMDYYNLQNLVSDTKMRESISRINKSEADDRNRNNSQKGINMRKGFNNPFAFDPAAKFGLSPDASVLRALDQSGTNRPGVRRVPQRAYNVQSRQSQASARSGQTGIQPAEDMKHQSEVSAKGGQTKADTLQEISDRNQISDKVIRDNDARGKSNAASPYSAGPALLSSEEELLRGIILSEVLGKPKCLRKGDRF